MASGATNYLSGVQYNAAHQPDSFTYGNGVVADPAYNSRLQLASLTYTKNTTKLLDLAYSYTSATHSGNNGQITRVQDNTGTPEAGRTADYTYDAWSRLKTALTTGSASYPQWGLSWDYDRYGNRKNQNVTAGSAPAPQLSISPTTNRITSTGYAYDSSGNLTNDTLYTYTFDAENRIKEVKQGSTVLSTSTYDGGSLRVKKVAGSNTTRYIFSGTKVIAEYVNGSLSKEYIYAGSQLVATIQGGTPTYHHQDQLSVRVNSNSSGTIIGQQGHYPFGESWYSASTTTKWQFTSYERDSESSLDYAIFRYDSSRLGRFMSPDLLAGWRRRPQSLNRYSYVLNQPINLTDPLALFPCPFANSGDYEAAMGCDISSELAFLEFGAASLTFSIPCDFYTGCEFLNDYEREMIPTASGNMVPRALYDELSYDRVTTEAFLAGYLGSHTLTEEQRRDFLRTHGERITPTEGLADPTSDRDLILIETFDQPIPRRAVIMESEGRMPVMRTRTARRVTAIRAHFFYRSSGPCEVMPSACSPIPQ